MKKCALFLTAMFLSIELQAAELILTVDKIKTLSGTLYISLHNTKDTWMKSVKPYALRKIPVTAKSVTINFGDLPEGNYAIMLFQDLNENQKIDFNSIKIPKEPYGFSNNVGRFAAPSFEDAQIKPADFRKLVIRLKGT